jgi:hypothetical protein
MAKAVESLPKTVKHPLTRPHPVSNFFSKYKHIMPFVTVAIIVGGTYLAVQIGKGYRPTTTGISGTGLLAANSFPSGAQVYLDGKLATATDDTLSLAPGEYTVTISKEGYLPWEKNLILQKELVSQTNATLFRSVASLTPLTLNGAANITPSPDGQKIAYVVATASATAKNGLYILDTTSNTFTLQRDPRQISKLPPTFNLVEATLLWSPNSQEILVHTEDTQGLPSNYLLNISTINDFDALPDVTARLSVILSEWEEEIVLRETKQFALLPSELQLIATQSASNIYFSPNEQRFLYTATASATIPENLLPKPVSPNTQPEDRNLQPNHLYVYDLTEDKNYHLGEFPVPPISKTMLLQSSYLPESATASAVIPITDYNRLQVRGDFAATAQNFRVHYSSINVDGFQWYPNSTHLLITYQNRVDVVEADATNWVTLYSGPFDNQFAYPWPDGSRLIILTNLNPATNNSANLYTVDIR